MISITDKVGLRTQLRPIHNDKDTVMSIYASNNEASTTKEIEEIETYQEWEILIDLLKSIRHREGGNIKILNDIITKVVQ